jgi:hypothetical protein
MPDIIVPTSFTYKKGQKGTYAIKAKGAIREEIIAVTAPADKYTARGFLVKDAESSAIFNTNRNYDWKQVVDLNQVCDSFCKTLNNLHSLGVLDKDQFAFVAHAHEPFFDEVLDFSEFEDVISSEETFGSKKKLFSRRERGRK